MGTKVQSTIAKFINLYGLPHEIGATGWISEISTWYYGDTLVGQSNEQSKGWISVNKESSNLNEHSYLNYTDADSVFAIASAICQNTSVDTTLHFEIHDKEFLVDLYNEDANGKGWEWVDGEDELERKVRELTNHPTDPEHPNYDDFDIDCVDFVWEQCQENIVETFYDFPYYVSFINWSNGAVIQLEIKQGVIKIKKIEHPPAKHQVTVYLKDENYYDEIKAWLGQNNISYELVFKPAPYFSVSFLFNSGEDATLFSLKFS